MTRVDARSLPEAQIGGLAKLAFTVVRSQIEVVVALGRVLGVSGPHGRRFAEEEQW